MRKEIDNYANVYSFALEMRTLINPTEYPLNKIHYIVQNMSVLPSTKSSIELWFFFLISQSVSVAQRAFYWMGNKYPRKGQIIIQITIRSNYWDMIEENISHVCDSTWWFLVLVIWFDQWNKQKSRRFYRLGNDHQNLFETQAWITEAKPNKNLITFPLRHIFIAVAFCSFHCKLPVESLDAVRKSQLKLTLIVSIISSHRTIARPIACSNWFLRSYKAKKWQTKYE